MNMYALKRVNNTGENTKKITIHFIDSESKFLVNQSGHEIV